MPLAVRKRRWTMLLLALSPPFWAAIAAQPAAAAANCPGNPDALGTSRTLVVDPREHPRIGTMQYPETLPLEDHEVVLTFDDGPLPKNSNQVLQILASQCVKATFFTIGRQAQANPEGVRKLRDAGHTIGTHSQNHPLSMNKMPIERAKQEIDDGIASTVAALGDPSALAPFFRIPGLLRAEAVEEYLGSLGIQTWSADFPADDWHHISSARVFEIAIKRLEAKGKGILLLHDIQARTVAALPGILHELKVRGYRIVHVVPATPERPATPTEPQQWQLHPPSENVAIAHWPKIPTFDFAAADTLSSASLSDLNWLAGPQMPEESLDYGRRSKHAAAWEPPGPRLSALLPENTAIALPVPSGSLFEIRDRPQTPRRAVAAAVREIETPVKLLSVKGSRRLAARHGHLRHGRKAFASRPSGHRTHQAAHVRGAAKRLTQVKRRRA